jgi:hypothetical protein
MIVVPFNWANKNIQPIATDIKGEVALIPV